MKRLIILLILLGLCGGCSGEDADRQAAATPPSLLASATPTLLPIPTDTPALLPTVTPVPTATTIATATIAIPSAPVTTTIAPSITAILTMIDAADNPQELATDGSQVYLNQYCGVCHRLDTLKTTGTFGPVHNQLSITATVRIQESAYHGVATSEAAYLLESLLDPQIYIVPGYELSSHRMPSYRHLPERDLAALVQFLLQQK